MCRWAVTLLVLWCVVATSVDARHPFVPDVRRRVADQFGDDGVWSWRSPGLFGMVVASDEGGAEAAPLAQARVEVRTTEGWEVGSTETDQEGCFRLAVDPGTYRIKVETRGYLPVTTGFGSCKVSRGRAGYVEVALAAEGDATAQEQERAREEVSIFETSGPMTGLSLEVVTRDEEDEPSVGVSGALVTFFARSGGAAKYATSDDDGLVVVALDPGVYDIEVECEGFRPVRSGSESKRVRSDRPSRHEIVLLTPAQVFADRLDEEAERQAEEAARKRTIARKKPQEPPPAERKSSETEEAPEHFVPHSGLTGHVYLYEEGVYPGKPLEGVYLTIVSQNGTFRRTARTLRDGYYSVSINEPGSYKIVPELTGYSSRYSFVGGGTVPEEGVGTANVYMVDSSSLERAEQEYRAARGAVYADQNPPAGVEGYVYTWNDRTNESTRIGGGEVTLLSWEGRELETATVTEEGNFAFACPPGKYKVEVRQRHYTRDINSVIVTKGTAYTGLKVSER